MDAVFASPLLGLATVLISITVVVVVVAMPFLVWGTHTRMQEVANDLSRVESRLSQLENEAANIRAAVYAIERMVEDLGRGNLTEETIAAIKGIRQHRIDEVAREVGVRIPVVPARPQFASPKVERTIKVVLWTVVAIAALITLYAVLWYKP